MKEEKLSTTAAKQQRVLLDEEEDTEDIVVIEDEDSDEDDDDEDNRQRQPLSIAMVDDDDDLSHEEYHDDEEEDGFHDEYRDAGGDERSKNHRNGHRHLSLSAKKTAGIVHGLVEQDQKKCCKYYWLCAPSQRRCLLRFLCLVIVPLTILPLALVWLSQPGNDLQTLLSMLEGGHQQQQTADDAAAVIADPSTAGGIGDSSSISSSSSLVHTTDLVMTKTQLAQIQNYKDENALMVNLHIGFHGGGSTFCYTIGKAVNDPSTFSCTKELDTSGHVVNHPSDTTTPQGHYPWTRKETAQNIQQLVHHQNVRMLSWSLQKPPMQEDDSLVMLQDTDWGNSHLVSVLLVQDPMVRIVTEALTHSKLDSRGRPLLVPGNSDEWWKYAKGHSSYKDNLALRIYSDGRGGHSHGTEKENQMYLQEAQTLIKRFTFVLDAACIEEGMDKLAEVLQIRLPSHHAEDEEEAGDDTTTADDDDDDTFGDADNGHRHIVTTPKKHTSGHASTHEHHSMRDEIGDDKVYNYLAEANKWDMELYQWSKGLALVQCK